MTWRRPDFEVQIKIGELQFHAVGSEERVERELSRFYEWTQKITNAHAATLIMANRPTNTMPS